MGSDDLFKKRRALRKKREYNKKVPKANSFLIVTEGERTEPLYFQGIKRRIEETIGGTLDVVKVPEVDIHGEGSSTGRLIQVTDRMVKEANVLYQNVWIVFDKDDFDDFNQAIRTGEEKGYKVAWSNQSFEYWLVLHFSYSDSALHRDEWVAKLKKIFKDYQLGDGTYKKNDENIYEHVNCYGGVNEAIKNAKRRMSGYDKDKIKPSEYDPGTMVYQLVEDMIKYLDD